jgi:putative transposase
VIARAEGPGDCSHNPPLALKRALHLMSQSLANIVVHLVFSTKDRRPLIRDQERGQLHAYITGILKNHDSPLIEINSVRDHIHLLFAQSKNESPAKIVEQVKASSSGWIKDLDTSYANFAWQTGYGEFSVSPMHVEPVREYIRSQAMHHRREDFQTEYRRFCEKNCKPLDERYAWE